MEGREGGRAEASDPVAPVHETPYRRVMHPRLTVVSHPLVQHKLTLMRRRETPTAEFRRLCREVAHLMAYEVTRDLPLASIPVETPLEPMMAPALAGKKLCVVSILRAGDGLAQGILDLIPSARVGHVGLYRDPVTKRPVEYYLKLPEDIAERPVILVDPMLATGHSAAAAELPVASMGSTMMTGRSATSSGSFR